MGNMQDTGNPQGTAEGAEREAFEKMIKNTWPDCGSGFKQNALLIWTRAIAWQQSRAQQAAPAQVAGEAAPLVWKKEKPTTKGWYYRRVVFVSNRGELEREVIYYEFPSSARDSTAVEIRFEWAGPIPEPQPPATPDHEGAA